MLRIGVLGAGHLGKIHLKCIKELSESYEIAGVFDPDPEAAERASREYGIKTYPSVDALIKDADVIDVVTPTLSHFECAAKAIRNDKHVFIEKPVTHTVEEAKKLIELNHEAKLKIQVGHVERFNPAFTSVRESIHMPMFIETHRLAEFNPRGTDVSVVLDLMIHDLDIVLSIVNSGVKKINAGGVAVISDTPDICNARIEFDNGCVANLTASRISLKNMRKTRIFQKDAYISVDFLEKVSEIVTMSTPEGEPDPLAVTISPGKGKKPKEIRFNRPEIKPVNAIKEELRSFAEAVRDDKTPTVPLEDGYKALDVAHRILEKLKLSPHLIAG